MSELRVLTGITTSGTPHLGNYVGAVRPAVRASLAPGVQSFYFLADYHALIKVGEPERIQQSTLEIAATWLAAGLDPERVTFYRQSDIPEIPELTWLLTCVTAKGQMNRAHAYKAAVDAAKAAVARATLNVSRTRLRAPFPAVVVSESADPGQFLGPGAGVAVLAGTDAAWVTVAALRSLSSLSSMSGQTQ